MNYLLVTSLIGDFFNLWYMSIDIFIQNQMNSTIKTAIRVRPLLKSESQQGYNNTKLAFNKEKEEVIVSDPSATRKFKCDHLITPQTSQDDTFSQCGISESVEKVLQGYNSTVFAYGQTGSGKSYTMHGGDQGQVGGIAGRITKLLFKRISENKNQSRFSVFISFLQIYSEKIYDLLNPASLNNRSLSISQPIEGLRLRWNKDEQFTVENLFVFECRDENELSKYISIGLKNRISATHKLNLQSSRSHSIMSIKLQVTEGTSTRHSRIDLVDLAGSERIGLTKTEGRLAKQSIDINKSLFTLRQVINVLSDNNGKKKEDKTYVPYRDSKLTSILKQSIGGNSYCLMIACLTPNDAFLQQNISTLSYATKVSFITNNPVLNLDPNTKVIIQLRKQLSQVNSQLQKANKHIQFLSQIKEKAFLQPKTQKYSEQMQLPNPQFNKKPQNEPSRIDYNSSISERLIESINMVRQLLKSNKELREKVEEAEIIIQDRNAEIYQLVQENQSFRENYQFLPSHKAHVEERKGAGESRENRYDEKTINSQGQRRNSLKIPAPITRPPSQQHRFISTSTNKKSQQPDKIMELGNLYLNEKGIDSAPTNFNKRITSTAQNQRTSFTRGSSQQMDRHAITAKFSKRGWLLKEGDNRPFFSFYEGSQD